MRQGGVDVQQEGVAYSPHASHRAGPAAEPRTREARTMATILKARGRMTKDLVTPYEVGQEVVLIDPQFDDPLLKGRFPVGDSGIIRKIIISDANDGDETFPMFYVRVGGF